MRKQTHPEARRGAQAIERIARYIRRLRWRGKKTEADAEVRAFRCGGVAAVPHGLFRQWADLLDEIERPRPP